MSKKQNVHVVPHPQGWATKTEGSERAGRVFGTQKEAIGQAQKQAERDRSEAVIHGTNGRIRDKDSYGNDPCPPKDKKH